MENAKYIIIEVKGLETAIIFPAYVQHQEIAQKMGKPVVSAGFVGIGISDGKMDAEAYGKSTSLKTQARPEDTKIIKRTLNLISF